MQPNTRYWTVLKYLSVLYLVYTVVRVVLNWESYRTAIVLPALFALALWKPKPIGWFFIVASLVIGTVSYALPAVKGLGHVGTMHVIGWGTPYDEGILRGQYFLEAIWLGATAMYFVKRKNMFIPPGTRLVWIKGVGAVLIALIIQNLSWAERALDPNWGPRNMDVYIKALGGSKTPEVIVPDLKPLAATFAQRKEADGLMSSHDEEMAQVQRLLQDATRSAKDISSKNTKAFGPKALEEGKSTILGTIARTQAKAGDVNGAVATADAITLTHVRGMALRYIAAAQAKERNIQEALLTANAIKRADLATTALQAIAGELSEQGDMPGAAQVANAIPTNYRKAPVLADIAVAQATRGDSEGSARTLLLGMQAARGETSKAVQYAALVSIAKAQLRAGDPMASAKTFQKAVEAAIEGQNKPDALRIIATAQSESGNQDASSQTFALAVQAAMSDTDQASKVLTLVRVAKAQAECGFREASQQTFRLAEENVATVADVYRKSHLLVAIATAEATADAHTVSAKTYEKASQLALAIPNDAGKVSALVEISTAQFRTRHEADALKNIQKALTIALTLAEPYPKAVALTKIANSQLKLGDPKSALINSEEAFKSLANVKTGDKDFVEYRHSSVLGDILKTQAEAGHTKEALANVNIIPDDNLKQHTVEDITDILVKRGDLQSALETARNIKSIWSYAHKVRSIAKAQAKAGDVNRAMEWAVLEIAPVAKAHALLGIAEGIMERKAIPELLSFSPPEGL